MTVHHKFDEPDTRHRLDAMVQGVIGRPLDRPDGPAKVTGTATFAHEWNLPGTVYGVLARATATKGRVESIDVASVEALPGVLAVIADARMAVYPAQGTQNTKPVAGPGEIRYFGQPLALVVAATFEEARHAATVLEARIAAEPAPVVHEEVALEEIEAESQGDLDAAMAGAAFTVDATYTTPGHNSAAMEPHASVASWEGDTLTLHGSYQMLKYNRNEIADALGIDPANVRIISPYVGGGFGSKLGIAPEAVAAALAAKALGRPVLVAMSRQQVFETVFRRSETRQHIRLAADGDGNLLGIGHEAVVSNIPGEDYPEPVTQATPFTYKGEHRVTGIRMARLHRVPAGSVRAPGEAVGIPCLENAMDELAEKLGMDPVALRLKNIPDKDPSSGKPFSSRRFAEALTEGARAFGWTNEPVGSRREGDLLIGTGMCSAVRVNTLQESEARVTLLPDGTAKVETDMTDLGTGTYAILTQIAAEMLGLPVARVTTVLGDTELPPSAGSGGSWGAASSGTSVFLACEELRRQIAARTGGDEADMTMQDGMVTAGNRRAALTDILAGEPMTAQGRIEPGAADKATRQASYGAYFAEVAVDAVTGETRVRRMLGCFGAGRILNAKTARSQCIGGMTWGIGMALTEEMIHDPRDGHVVNRDLAEYHLPVNADVPQLEVILLEERDDWANPLQAKGLGELGICGAAGSIINAIHNATGVRVRDYPATLDKVLAGMA